MSEFSIWLSFFKEMDMGDDRGKLIETEKKFKCKVRQMDKSRKHLCTLSRVWNLGNKGKHY